jgi:hypothetical protein
MKMIDEILVIQTFLQEIREWIIENLKSKWYGGTSIVNDEVELRLSTEGNPKATLTVKWMRRQHKFYGVIEDPAKGGWLGAKWYNIADVADPNAANRIKLFVTVAPLLLQDKELPETFSVVLPREPGEV